MSLRVIALLLGVLSFPVLSDSLTISNLRGQKYLLEKGWYVITSPVEAWKFAEENSEESWRAFDKALKKAREEAQTATMKENLSSAIESMKSTYEVGIGVSNELSATGKKSAQKRLSQSKRQLEKAWSSFTLGYVEYRANNEEDIESLKKINREFLKRQNEDVKSLDEGLQSIFGAFLDKTEIEWRKYFKEGTYHFQNQYAKSGNRSNSIQGLWDVMSGYAKFLYYSIVKPTGKTLKKGAVNSGHYASEAVLHTFITAYNVIYSSGANLYYSLKLGYKVISPTVEAGLYSSLALINAASAPVIWGGLEGVGTITKVATTSVAPLVGGGQFTIAETTDTAKKAAVYLYRGGTGVTRVGLEGIESGVVLGYSALSQLPPQILLTSMNSVIFLVYDGPRMLLVKAQGKIDGEEIAQVPVGTVMDMKKLERMGVDIVPISNDEFILKKVLQYAE